MLQRQLDNEKQVLKDLEKQYKVALKDIDEKLATLMGRTDADMQHVIFQVDYQKALKTQIQAILEQLHANEFETISEYLANCYDDGFVGTIYSLNNQGVPLIIPIDQNAVIKAIQTESKISEKLYTRLGKDVTELRKNITAEITRGISTGMLYSEISRNIDNASNVGLNRAARITRTEGNRIQNKASMDALYKAKEKGCDPVKMWCAALDGDTRPSHRQVDGETRELDEKFSNGLRYPLDPQGSASEVVNCRCTLLKKPRWSLDESELHALKERAKYFGLDKTKDFEDFKKKYLKAAKEVVENSVKSSTIKSEKVKTKKSDYKKLSQKSYEDFVKPHDMDYFEAMEYRGYVASPNSFKMNDILRNGGKLKGEDLKTYKAMMEKIQSTELPENLQLTRYAGQSFLDAIAGENGIPTVGDIVTEKGFLSTSAVTKINMFTDRPVKMTVLADKGTHAFITNNKKESEIIFPPNTSYEILSVKKTKHGIEMVVKILER